MVQVFAAKKGTSWLRRNALTISILALILYAGYKISQGLKAFSLPMLPSLPEISLPMLPNIPFPTQPDPVMMQQMQSNVTPSEGGTGLVNIPTMLTNMITDFAKKIMELGLVPFTQPSGQIIYVTPESREILSQRYYGVPFSYQHMPSMMYDKPIGAPTLQDVGLGIDIPTKQGVSPMAQIMPMMLDVVQKVKGIFGSAMAASGSQGVGQFTIYEKTPRTLSDVISLYPNLTASQARDFLERLMPTTTGYQPTAPRVQGAGGIPTFNELNMVTSFQPNPVLKAYEAYRAMYA